MPSLAKLAGGSILSRHKTVDNAPVAIENVFAIIRYTGIDNSKYSSTAVQADIFSPDLQFDTANTNNPMSVVNFGNEVVLVGVCVDLSGNCYSVGYQITTTGQVPYIAKMAPSGALLWSYSLTAITSGLFADVKIDPSGYICAVGNADNNFLVAKFDVNGGLQWVLSEAYSISGSTTNTKAGAQRLVFDTIGNIYLTGTVVNNNPTPITSSAFVAYVSTAGVLQWAVVVTPSSGATYPNTTGNAIARDSTGNIFVALTSYVNAQNTTFYNDSQVISASATENTVSSGFVVKLNASGAYETSIRLNSTATYSSASVPNSGCTAIVIDASDNVYVGGWVGEYQSVGLQFSNALVLNWGMAEVTTFLNYPTQVCLDNKGNVYFGNYLNCYKYTTAGTFVYGQVFYDFVGINAMVIDTTDTLTLVGTLGVTENAVNLALNQVNSSQGWPYEAGSICRISQASNTASGNAAGGAFVYGTSVTPPASSTCSTIIGSTLVSTAATFSTIALSAQTKFDPTVTAVYNSAPSNYTLATTGGTAWFKCINTTDNHALIDQINYGAGYYLSTDQTTAVSIPANTFNFTLDGAVLNSTSTSLPEFISNETGDYISWFFTNYANFFDTVEYVGNGTTQVVSHGLNAAVGMIMIKAVDGTNAHDWAIYHREEPGNYATLVSKSGFVANVSIFGNNAIAVAPTTGSFTVGSDLSVNASGTNYVAYLFAHDASTTGLIQCGSYTGANNSNAPEVTLGWEPQYLMILPHAAGTNVTVYDYARGLTTDGFNAVLPINSNEAAATYSSYTIPTVAPSPTGFVVKASTTLMSTTQEADISTSGLQYNYVAIRRGPLIYPTSGTSVFNAIAYSSTGIAGSIVGFGFSPDIVIATCSTGTTYGPVIYDRLRGALSAFAPPLFTANTNSETTLTLTSDTIQNITMDGFTVGLDTTYGIINHSGSNYVYWGFKRAPGFLEQVCYQGAGGQLLNHNLGAIPELIIFANRTAPEDRYVWSNKIPAGYLKLNTTDPAVASASFGLIGDGTQDYLPTIDTFYAGSLVSVDTSHWYAAYLFASAPGVSVINTYVGNGTTLTINCQFQNGPRFILIKNTTAAGDWYVWDSARGTTSQLSAHTSLNTVAADVTTDVSVVTTTSGFMVSQLAATNINVNGNVYLYFAIA